MLVRDITAVDAAFSIFIIIASVLFMIITKLRARGTAQNNRSAYISD